MTLNSTLDAAVDIATAHALVSAGDARLLDVRESDEWNAGHVDGAVHIPLAQLGGRLKELDHNGSWLAICRSGGRSDRATDVLRGIGVNIRNVAGGMRAWSAAGLPYVASDGTSGTVI